MENTKNIIPQFNFDSYFVAGASTSLPTLDLGAHSHHLAGSQPTANAAAAAAAVNQSAARAAAAAAVAAVHPFLQLQKAASGEPFQQYSNNPRKSCAPLLLTKPSLAKRIHFLPFFRNAAHPTRIS